MDQRNYIGIGSIKRPSSREHLSMTENTEFKAYQEAERTAAITALGRLYLKTNLSCKSDDELKKFLEQTSTKPTSDRELLKRTLNRIKSDTKRETLETLKNGKTKHISGLGRLSEISKRIKKNIRYSYDQADYSKYLLKEAIQAHVSNLKQSIEDIEFTPEDDYLTSLKKLREQIKKQYRKINEIPNNLQDLFKALEKLDLNSTDTRPSWKDIQNTLSHLGLINYVHDPKTRPSDALEEHRKFLQEMNNGDTQIKPPPATDDVDRLVIGQRTNDPWNYNRKIKELTLFKKTLTETQPSPTISNYTPFPGALNEITKKQLESFFKDHYPNHNAEISLYTNKLTLTHESPKTEKSETPNNSFQTVTEYNKETGQIKSHVLSDCAISTQEKLTANIFSTYSYAYPNTELPEKLNLGIADAFLHGDRYRTLRQALNDSLAKLVPKDDKKAFEITINQAYAPITLTVTGTKEKSASLTSENNDPSSKDAPPYIDVNNSTVYSPGIKAS
ncbi:MAG: hypothetical protein CMF55_07125 [Legionellales bacterium]|nr:hypothetical protein [Legionellales bacterium]